MAQSTIYNLSDGGSTASVDLTVGDGGGMNSWMVDTDPGVNQLAQQWFYFSINGGAVQSIDQIGGLYVNPNSTANFLNVTYKDSQVSFNIQYFLSGNGSSTGNADISENIAVDNLSSSAFSIQFYQFSHFTLLNSGANSVQIAPDLGSPPEFNFAQQTSGSTALGEVIAAPDANYAEAGTPTQVMTDIFHQPHLTGNYYTGANLSAGPGDVSWAFEWDDSSLNPLSQGDELDISKDKSLSIAMVPEPSSFALIALGLGAAGFLRRKMS